MTLELLDDHLKEGRFVFDTDEVAWAYRIVADTYREWGRGRIIEALGLKEGALRLPVVSFNLVLLVNGSIGPEHALPIPESASKEAQLSGILAKLVDAFEKSLRPDARRSEPFRLRGGWIVTETRRHLFDFVDFGSTAIWLRVDRTQDLVRRLAGELRRQRHLSRDDVAAAFDALTAAYADARPALASWGIAHERTPNTRRLRSRLLEHYEQRRSEANRP